MSEGVFDPNVTMNDVIKMVSPENVKLDNQNVKEVIHEITKEVENTIQSKGELDENKGYFILFLILLIVMGYFAYKWSKSDDDDKNN